MATAVSKAKVFSAWPTAMVTSLGLHLAAILFALSDAPRRPSDPMIEVDVVPVRVEVSPPVARHELNEVAPVPPGRAVQAKRRVPVMARLAVVRPARATPSVASHAEASPAQHAIEPVTAPGPASVESVIVAKAAAVEGSGQGSVSNPGPGVTAARLGSPRTVAPAVGDGLLAIDPNDGRYQPTIPQPLRKPGASFLTRLKFCVGADGSVDKVTVVTSSEPTLDQAILDKARLYRFHPYLDQGRPIPFCFYREYRLSIHE
jgi:outer membrane biosynthesis protein TonB